MTGHCSAERLERAARILQISDKTAGNHVISLMAKLEAKHRTETVTAESARA